MFRNMIPGSCMESLSESGQAGIRIQDSILPDLELLLASALESAISAASAGAGTTGVPTGVAGASFITTTPTYPTVECSSIATTSITPADFMAEADSKAGVRAEGQVEVRRSTGLGPQHGFAAPNSPSAPHSGAFGGFNHGGATRGFSSRGQSSFGGGFHGGGGSMVVEASTAAAVTGKAGFTHRKQLTNMENEIMQTTNLISETSSRLVLNGMAVIAALGLLVVGFAQWSLAQKAEPRVFSSPGEAGNALFQAVQSNDEQAVERILGGGKEITSSSDEIEDRLERERFSQKYQEMHRLVREPDGTTVLYIGAENWPFPIPLASKNGAWHFDSDAGTGEILFRTIGENEITAIQVCHGVAKAKEHSQAETTGDDPIIQYARSLLSGSAANAETSARDADHQPSLFHGYYFRL